MTVFILALGAAAGGAAIWYFPKVKAWFSDESAVIAAAVKSRI